jgi:hypothetical protein
LPWRPHLPCATVDPVNSHFDRSISASAHELQQSGMPPSGCTPHRGYLLI